LKQGSLQNWHLRQLGCQIAPHAKIPPETTGL